MKTKRKHRTNTPKPRYVKPALELTFEDHLEAMRVMALANTIRDTLGVCHGFKGSLSQPQTIISMHSISCSMKWPPSANCGTT